MNDGPFNKQFLCACLEQDRYRFHPSAWKRLGELHISVSDILHVLRHGSIDEEPEFDLAHENWRFTVRGNTVDRKELSIMFTFVEIEGVLILAVAE